MINTTSAAQLIRAAIEYLRERGLCKTSCSDSEGRVCIAAAISRSAGNELWRLADAASDAVGAVALTEYGTDYVAMTGLPWTTTDDAIALMEKAAIRLEEQVSA